MVTHHPPKTSDLKVAFMGLAVGLVWIAIVGTIAHFWALGASEAEGEHPAEVHAPPA